MHPTQFSFVAAEPAVREFQVVHRGAQILLRLSLRDDAVPGTEDRVGRALAERLSGLGVKDPDIATETVEAIERSAAGKLKLIVNETATAGAPERAAGAERRTASSLTRVSL